MFDFKHVLLFHNDRQQKIEILMVYRFVGEVIIKTKSICLLLQYTFKLGENIFSHSKKDMGDINILIEIITKTYVKKLRKTWSLLHNVRLLKVAY